MSERLRISAKHLGELALPDHCERCFQIKLDLHYKLPYQVFPGIFSSIDSFSKKITDKHYEFHGDIPLWLEVEGRPLRNPSVRDFQWHDLETNVLLTGVPDSIIRKPDETLAIIDYKTARYTDGQDHLLPLYHVQLNGYALIAEQSGWGRVTELLLVYYEPDTEVTQANVRSLTLSDGFVMPFYAKTVRMELDRDLVREKMEKAKSLFDGSRGEHREGCAEGLRLRELVSLIS